LANNTKLEVLNALEPDFTFFLTVEKEERDNRLTKR
jgi:thymidylate kinase